MLRHLSAITMYMLRILPGNNSTWTSCSWMVAKLHYPNHPTAMISICHWQFSVDKAKRSCEIFKKPKIFFCHNNFLSKYFYPLILQAIYWWKQFLQCFSISQTGRYLRRRAQIRWMAAYELPKNSTYCSIVLSQLIKKSKVSRSVGLEQKITQISWFSLKVVRHDLSLLGT